MNKRKVITQANFAEHHLYFGDNYSEAGVFIMGEVNTLPSKTVPGQQMSLRQMLERYVRGQDVQQFNGVYLGEDADIPDSFERMTEIERKEAAWEIRDYIEEQQQKRPKPQKPEPAPAPAPQPLETPGTSNPELK